MKIKALLVVLLVAGFAASLALAKGPKPTKPATTTTTTTTTTAVKPKCNQVELKGQLDRRKHHVHSHEGQ